ncbi:MAG: hypothetical protein JSS96_14520 [Bacteroidetes bacterium]|nr:hypothetical protein [Bacteroidota bacterium]
MNRLYGFLFLVCLFASGIPAVAQHIISNDAYRYQLTINDSLVQWHDSASAAENESIFYDNYSGVVFMITVREGLFTDNKSYIDCAKDDLELRLREYQGDSTLRLLSCNRSKYYPEQAVVLHFESHIYPAGLNRCMIYFIHHNGKELQFSFIYDKAADKVNLEYIDRIMQNLKLF